MYLKISLIVGKSKVGENQKLINFFVSVLKAINEDSPTVPTLLTDYILKGNYFLNISLLCVLFHNRLDLYKIYYVYSLPYFNTREVEWRAAHNSIS